MLQGKVSRICDQESEQVASHTILSSAYETSELLAKSDHLLMRALSPRFGAFKEHGASDHVLWVETFDLDHIEFLCSIDKVLPFRVALRLECSTKLELCIVHESQR